MRQITLRGIEDETEQKIRELARKDRKSINQVIKEIIHKEFGEKHQKSRAAPLRRLAGGWSFEQASEFEISIKSCEQIDEDMWK